MQLKPLKKLGQNFLKNVSVLQYVANAAEISADDIVVEVGAGTGLLTEHLAKTGARVITVEKDKNLIPVLESKFKNQKNVTIIEEDILKLRFNGKSAAHLALDPRLIAREFSGKRAVDLLDIKIINFRYKVVGNIPYYLTSHLLKKILTEWPSPKLILFMVQKEVAQRIAAKPPKMSLLALSVQFYADVKILKYVPKENFWPIPKVDSALIKILPKEQNQTEKIDIEKVLKLARSAFSGKRKQILNSLSAGLDFPREVLGEKLNEAEIDSKRRPETLSLNEWEKLSKIFSLQAG